MALGFQISKTKSTTNTQKIRENALFHYTDAWGLMGILSTRSIWATAYYCTNDRSEFNYSTNLIEEIFRDVLFKRFPNASDTDICSLAMRLHLMYLSDAKKQIDDSKAFISCFTMAKDNDSYKHGLLSQWRGYGRDGGYAIELNALKFFNEIHIWANKYSEGSKKHKVVGVPIFSKVIYKDKKNHWADTFRETHIEPLINLFDDIEDMSFDKINDALSSLKVKNEPGALVLFSAFSKNPHFIEEHEYRLMVLLNQKCDYFNRGGLIVPYLAPPIDIKYCINRIIIGPSHRIEDREKSVRSLLKSNDMSHVEVTTSEIPYNKG